MSEQVLKFDQAGIRRMVRYGIILLVAGMLGNLVFSLVTTDRQMILSLQRFQPVYFFLAVFLSLVPWITNTLRLMIWTRFLGKPYSLRELIKIVLGADIGSAITPTAIGGGYVKAGMLVQRGFNAGAAASLMTLGSVEDGVFFALALPMAFFISSGADNSIVNNFFSKLGAQYEIVFLVLSGLILVTGLVIFIAGKTGKLHTGLVNKIRGKISKVWQDFSFVYLTIGKTGKSRFLLSLLLTAIQWICRYSVLTVLLKALGITVDPVLFFLVQWLTFSIMTTIPTPGAVAGAEASFYIMYAHLIPRDFLGLITTGWRFLTFYLQVGLAIILISCISFFNLQK